MKNASKSIIACTIVCGLTALSLAQNTPAKPATPAPAKPTAPATPAKPAAPEVKAPAAPAQPTPEDMKKMMEAWAATAMPGKEHATLTANVGVWDGKCTMHDPMSGKTTESVCVTTTTSMLGGRFTRSETQGKMDMGMGPADFEGFGLTGYNNVSKKYESTWCDNFGTLILNFTGDRSADGKVLTLTTHFKDPMSGQDSWMREVETVTGPNTMTLEMYGPSMDGKGEMKMMEIAYTRRPGTEPKAAKPAEAKPAAKIDTTK